MKANDGGSENKYLQDAQDVLCTVSAHHQGMKPYRAHTTTRTRPLNRCIGALQGQDGNHRILVSHTINIPLPSTPH